MECVGPVVPVASVEYVGPVEVVVYLVSGKGGCMVNALRQNEQCIMKSQTVHYTKSTVH